MTPEEDRAALNRRLMAVWPGRAAPPEAMPIDRLRAYVGRLEASAASVADRGRLAASWSADDAMAAVGPATEA